METIRDFQPATRYVYDFGCCSYKNGFAQIDTGQDASYFGTWISPDRLMIVCYCEGDITIQKAENEKELVDELGRMKQWNDQNGHKFYGIDPGLDKKFADKFRKIGLGNFLNE